MSFTLKGQSTLAFTNPPSVASFGAIVGKKEGEGPYGKCFDRVEQDAYFNQKSWEAAESSMFKEALPQLWKRAALKQATSIFLQAAIC